MDLKGQEAPNSLGRTQVTGLKILLNLVLTDRGRRTVPTFINVLCDVLMTLTLLQISTLIWAL
jgi:hypothetical protein